MKTGTRVLVATATIVGLGALGLVCQRVAARGRYAAAYSTYGAGPQGARGLFLLADSLGARPTRWSEDLARLPPRGMMLALGGCDVMSNREVSKLERDVLGRWVEGGGVLVVAGARDYLSDDLGVSLDRSELDCMPDIGWLRDLERKQRERERRARDAGPEAGTSPVPSGNDVPRPGEGEEDDPFGGTSPAEAARDLVQGDRLPAAQWAVPGDMLTGLPTIPLRQPATVRLAPDAHATTILVLPSGPAGVVIHRGRGVIVAIASASVLQNREVESGEGAVLFARLVRAYAPRGPILFDEYHLGVGEQRSLMRYVGQVGGAALALQLLVVIALVLWRHGARLGRPRLAPLPPPAGTASYVSAVGALYGKSKDPAGAIAIVVRHALGQVAAHHHITTAEPGALVKALEERKQAEAVAAVRDIVACVHGVASDTQMVGRARDVDRAVARATKK